jgi:hypothetical protein
MVLFGNEFHADEGAEVGGGLRSGEGYEAIPFPSFAVLSVKVWKYCFNDRWRAGHDVNQTDRACDFVSVAH